MRIFGFDLSISRRSAPDQQPALTLSSEAQAWLRGEDPVPTSCLHSPYEQSVWVYRAINTLADQVANIPFLFSRGHRGRESLITSGPLLDFYDRPHPCLNRFQYWELRVLWLMLRGECFRVPIYSNSPPPSAPHSLRGAKRTLKTILFLDPARVLHIIADHQLIGWRYTSLDPLSPLDSHVFLPEEVWFDRLPNPLDPWRGLAPLYLADLPAKTDFAASSFMRGLIENNAESGLIVRTEHQLSDEQRAQIRADLRDRKRRAGAADKSILLWGVNEIVQPRLSSADLQFLENRKFSRAEICAAFGVPEDIVTTTDHNKYDVMQGARLNFIENRVAPLCARLEAEEHLTVNALDPTALGWFDLDSLPIMQAARRSRLIAAKTGFEMGIPFNELNRVLDLGFQPTPWGNNGFLPAKYQVLSAGPPSDANRILPAVSLPQSAPTPAIPPTQPLPGSQPPPSAPPNQAAYIHSLRQLRDALKSLNP